MTREELRRILAREAETARELEIARAEKYINARAGRVDGKQTPIADVQRNIAIDPDILILRDAADEARIEAEVIRLFGVPS